MCPLFAFVSDRMKINDLKMATPIEEKIDQNLKVSLIDCNMRGDVTRELSRHLFIVSTIRFRMLSYRSAPAW